MARLEICLTCCLRKQQPGYTTLNIAPILLSILYKQELPQPTPPTLSNYFKLRQSLQKQSKCLPLSSLFLDKTSRNFSEVCSQCAPSCVETDYGTRISQTQIISSIDDWIALNTKYYRRDKPGDHANNPSFYRLYNNQIVWYYRYNVTRNKSYSVEFT